MQADIQRLLADLTLQEKAALLSGKSVWETAGCERLGVGSIVITDGPHGLRLQDPDADHAGFDNSLPATCFPTASALGSCWDVDLLTEVGRALGAECRAAGVGVLLGPGINIKRSPLCGRNFEYLAEDPVVAGRLGAALVEGVQSQGVGASVKHFAANNQETDRMRVSAEVDERTLREIYLAGFEHVVKAARPWTLMAAYNRVNGVYASQNAWLLTRVLREEWGFAGVTVSDWGAVVDPVAAVAAGLDLEMPATGGLSAPALVAAVREGRLAEPVLDQAVVRLLALAERAAGSAPTGDADHAAHHLLARRAAAESAVLLKNQDAILPLAAEPGTAVAVIGEFARTPRYQGAGSSRVNPTRLDTALDALGESIADLSFAAGFELSGAANSDLLAEAVRVAAAADVAVVFLGLLDSVESEGYDREHLDLPGVQLELLAAVAEVSSRVVVVLANGGVVEVSGWERHAGAILEGWLAGQAGGGAIADLLLGRVNPSGRLAETIPLRLQDNPAYLDFPGADGHVRYGERLYVGYRYYDAREMAVGYPFGHGLSYTEFGYSGLSVEVAGEGPDVRVHLRFTLTNTGPVTGKEVVQVYVRDLAASVDRPVRELKAFGKVELAAGQRTVVEFTLTARDLSYYGESVGDWVLEAGDFELGVGASSRDLRLTTTVTVRAPELNRPLAWESTIGEWLAHPVGGPLLTAAMHRSNSSARADADLLRMLEPIPLDRLVRMSAGRFPRTDIDQYLAQETM